MSGLEPLLMQSALGAKKQACMQYALFYMGFSEMGLPGYAHKRHLAHHKK